MKVSVDDSQSCQKILKIEIGQEAIAKEYEEFYRAVAPHARIPGFRPGKAPRQILAMHYRQEAREHVLKHLISSSLRQVVREKSLQLVGHPMIDKVEFDQSRLSFHATVETRPKIKLSRVSGLSAPRPKVEVKPEEIEATLKQVQESLAKFKVVEDRPAALGDFVIADYVCYSEGREVDPRKGDWFELKEDEFLKGFSSQLVGVKPGDEKEVHVTFPENFGRKEFASKPAVFKLKVKEIKTKVLPELNDELAKDAGDFEALADLRLKIEKDLKVKKELEAENAYEKALLDELLKHNKIDLPQGVVQKRIEQLEDQLRHQLLGEGMPEAVWERQKNQLRPQLEEEAKRQVHLSFLLDEIAVQQSIVATYDDLKVKYEQLAQRFRQSADKIEKYYQEHPEALDSLRSQVRTEKVIEWIKKNAKQQ